MLQTYKKERDHQKLTCGFFAGTSSSLLDSSDDDDVSAVFACVFVAGFVGVLAVCFIVFAIVLVLVVCFFAGFFSCLALPFVSSFDLTFGFSSSSLDDSSLSDDDEDLAVFT